jgi:hypothetical protein
MCLMTEDPLQTVLCAQFRGAEYAYVVLHDLT